MDPKKKNDVMMATDILKREEVIKNSLGYFLQSTLKPEEIHKSDC